MWTLWGHLNVYIYEKTGSLYTSICQGPFLAFLKPDYRVNFTNSNKKGKVMAQFHT